MYVLLRAKTFSLRDAWHMRLEDSSSTYIAYDGGQTTDALIYIFKDYNPRL